MVKITTPFPPKTKESSRNVEIFQKSMPNLETVIVCFKKSYFCVLLSFYVCTLYFINVAENKVVENTHQADQGLDHILKG